MKEAIGDFLRANSKAIAAFVVSEALAVTAKFVTDLDVSFWAAQLAPLASAAIVWLAPKNKEA